MLMKIRESIPAYTNTYRRLFNEQYLTMQYSFVQFFSEHLADVSRVFEADLQTVVILAILGQMEIEARIRSRFQGQGPIPPAALVGRPPRTNSSSIAEVTGIPRETVRRKLEALARRGWVERDADGLWHIKPDGPNTASARRDLIDIDRRQMDRVSRYLGQMHAMAVETQARPAIDPLTQLSPANSPGEVA